MKVWQLNIDEVNFTPYYIAEEQKIDDFFRIVELMQDNNRSYSAEWEPLVLLKEEQCIDPDFFDIMDTGAVITSEQGTLLFTSFFEEKDIELLPFLNDQNKFSLVNILKTVDCLDKDNSIFENVESGLIIDYEFLAFDYDKIQRTPIFKVPELPYMLFITSTFKYFYDELNLKGINFSDENLIYLD